MIISLEDGSVQISDTIIIRNGMTFKDAHALRNTLGGYKNTNQHQRSIIFPPVPDVDSGFWVIASFFNDCISNLLIQVPYMNSTHVTKEEQIEYMEQHIGIQFFNELDTREPYGEYEWGTIAVVWETHNAAMEIRMKYR